MIAAVIDIGSGSVGLGLVEIVKGRAPILKYSARRSLRFQEVIVPEVLIQSSVESVRQLVADMQLQGQEAPSKIFCFLSPHLIISESSTIRINYGAPTKINAKIIDKAVADEIAKRKGSHSEEERVIEQKILSIKLNGYETTSLKDKVANELEIALFSTLAPAYILKLFEESIAGAFHNEQLEFHSFSSAYFTILRDLFPNERDFIYIDIGSEITDIGAIEDGLFKRSVSYPSGKNSLIRQMMLRRNIGHVLAANTLKAYGNNSLKDSAKEEFERDLLSSGRKWADLFKKALSEATSQLPHKIFCLADKDVVASFDKLMDARGATDAKIIGPDALNLQAFYQNRSRTPDDLFIIIPSIFVNKLLN